MNLENLLEVYGIIILLVPIIIIIYHIILLSKVCVTAKETHLARKRQEEIKDILIVLERKNLQQTKLLERIATVLETDDSEPYIIEKENE